MQAKQILIGRFVECQSIKEVGGRRSVEELYQALFFVSPFPPECFTERNENRAWSQVKTIHGLCSWVMLVMKKLKQPLVTQKTFFRAHLDIFTPTVILNDLSLSHWYVCSMISVKDKFLNFKTDKGLLHEVDHDCQNYQGQGLTRILTKSQSAKFIVCIKTVVWKMTSLLRT